MTGRELIPWSRLVLRVAQGPEEVADGRDVALAAADDVGDQARPPGLVHGAQPRAVVAVEVLGEQQGVCRR